MLIFLSEKSQLYVDYICTFSLLIFCLKNEMLCENKILISVQGKIFKKSLKFE